MINIKKIKFILKSIRIYIKYQIGRPVPFLLIIVPTGLCNLKCSYCDSYSKYRKFPKKNEIDYNTLKKIIDDAHKLKIPLISFSGGEPLLSKNIEEIAKYAHNKGITLNLNTNGTLITEKRAKNLVKYFDYIRISLDGCKTTHDKITGVKGTYQKVIEGLKNLNHYKDNKCKIGVNIIYSKEKESEILNLTKKLKNYVDFIALLPKFNFFQSLNRSLENKSQSLDNLIKKIKSLNININRDFISNPILNKDKYCDYGKLYSIVYPNGVVGGCPFIFHNLKLKMGNIYESSLNQIIKKNIKRKYKINCQGCYATCTTQISKLFRKKPISLIKEFIKIQKEKWF